jgi:dipeptidyl aminopeptidase/acylaminoacyl peptidase
VSDEQQAKRNIGFVIDALAELNPPADAQLSPDGQQIVFTMALGGIRQIFSVPSSGGWPRQLTAGELSAESPRWSPDGSRLAFVQGKAITVADANGSHPRVLTDHPAGNSMPRWSPDGARIAFYSRRRGWSQIWIVPAEGGEPRRLTDSAEDNDDLQWSPDGSRIAYSSIRGPELNNRDIYCVDVELGLEQRLSRVQGCFDGAPAWSPDGELIAFLSDQDGWVHVYLMKPDGSERRQLSFGSCEDGWPTISRGALYWSADGARLLFNRNRDAMLDLMLLDLASGGLQRLPLEDGFYQPAGWSADGRHVLCLVSRPDSPPDLWLVAASGDSRRITWSLPGVLQPSDFALPERVSYPSADGLVIQAHLYRPGQADAAARCPAIVHPHGGPTYQSYFGWPDPMVQIFVQQGYAVIEPDFRGSSGYGREFRLANSGNWGRSDARDCSAAANYLRTLDWVDGDRIGIWGGSYGGYLTLCCLTETPQVFKAGIDMFGDSEIAESYRRGDRMGRLDLLRQMGSPEENADAYRRGSPVYRAERIESPLLILHGRDDARVIAAMSERMIEALKIEGKFFEQQFYEGEGHGFRRPATRRDAYRRMLEFFDRHLKGGS